VIEPELNQSSVPSRPRWLPPGTLVGFLAVLVVSINLRGPIAAVSPVLPQMRDDLSMGPGAAGLLTTLPVLCFALASTAVLALYRRTGAEMAVVLSLVVLAVGTLIRSAPTGSAVPALVGTVFIGLAITVGNVIVPVVVKRDFGRRSAVVIGLYTACLSTGAGITAALTAPIAAVTGWRWALLSWNALLVVAVLLWLPALLRHRRNGSPAAPAPQRHGPMWRDRTALALALVFGTQSTLYYAMTAWLPSLLRSAPDAGGVLLAEGTAGVALSALQLIGIVGSLLVPALVGRGRDQRWLGVCIASGWVTTLAGLWLAPQLWPLWVLLGGLSQGGGISYAFALLVLRSRDDQAAARLSGFAQMVGYAIAAAGPVLMGAIFDAMGHWGPALGVLTAVAVMMAGSSWVAGRRTTVSA